MPNIASPLGTSNSAIPLVNAGQLAQAAGLHTHFPTAAAFQAAVTSEQANVLLYLRSGPTASRSA